jgi:hypothetical protein
LVRKNFSLQTNYGWRKQSDHQSHDFEMTAAELAIEKNMTM